MLSRVVKQLVLFGYRDVADGDLYLTILRFRFTPLTFEFKSKVQNTYYLHINHGICFYFLMYSNVVSMNCNFINYYPP